MGALVTVTGRFEYPDNTPLDGGCLVWQLIPAEIPDTSEPVTVLGGPVHVPIDSEGAFTAALRATDDPDLIAHVSGDLVYRVSRMQGNQVIRYTVALPMPGPWDFTALSPAVESDAAIIPVPGPQGPSGPKGETGDQGPQGTQGIQGLQGDQGEQGLQGDQGIQGIQGIPGPPLNWLQVTQAQYDALTPDPAVLYVIIG